MQEGSLRSELWKCSLLGGGFKDLVFQVWNDERLSLVIMVSENQVKRHSQEDKEQCEGSL